ncbi:cell division protein SepF [Clostridium botulinum]|uniref:Cell division protein SepF n=1 Tax=Clostridium botulinum C/D str. DC5 TaxID=1443128 RepID=A0A0A0IKA0_CLOBO|nr:cell division protein SepF [Clostridium botulinum]KEI02117.1 cell division protein SepF [Clostridium botulinum C/D str. BKT75002]KEI09459.1 cell division protein SepF [Clostridium botulinum C/D str. BKT2873]KGM96653.1 cell division protein SepF [Clostridium botulinum D str. CCUG 7971]KGN01895.1 cell division protein SepF [Clostridium botulinum C/D str. DC5]KOC48531.1 cell division protein SepF [Clostridium botulinum]
MAKKMLNKVMDFLGLEEEIDEIEEMDNEALNEENGEIENIFDASNVRNQKGKVVSIHTAASTKVIILKPMDYDAAIEICDNLKARKIIVVNMTSLESKIAQRLLDFIAGASYALGGSLDEIDKGVYIISPSNVEITNELKNELSSKGILNWTK